VSGGIRSALCLLILATNCMAQEGLTIQNRSREKVQEAEVQKLYVSACAIVRQEFHDQHLDNPAMTLVIGADKDEMLSNEREIRLVRWNPYLFAQGVVMLVFQDLLTVQRKLNMTTRAVSQADATVAVQQLVK
jgi:hypothetical protein